MSYMQCQCDIAWCEQRCDFLSLFFQPHQSIIAISEESPDTWINLSSSICCLFFGAINAVIEMSLEWSENGDEENVVVVLGNVIDIAVLLSE